ncbi:hypothetical protein [Roseomonas mucosa]|uniref:hypothetical protein n=1 Tax=Roseomonas mucosa TaxID=207340 RepID=UPI002247B625|nr:hypothetical protein [Roseomonas mucosa]
MMDDEASSSGMGTLAAFVLGRMSAANEQAESNFARSMVRRFQPRAPTVDVNALLAENQALHAQVQELQKSLRAYEFNYRRLEQWAEQADAALDKYRQGKG